MTELAVMTKSAVQEAIQSLRGASRELERFCQHLARSLRGSYLQLMNAVHRGDDVEALGIFERIRESDLVSGLAAKLHGMRESISEAVEALAPWFKVIGGLVVGLVGFFVFAESSILIAGVLVVGGFLYAIQHGLDAVAKAALRD